MGLSVTVIALHTLLDYKKILGRPMDLVDIEQIEKIKLILDQDIVFIPVK